MAEKMTKKDWFKELRELVSNSEYGRKEDMLKFIDNEVELLTKKSSKSGSTKTQKENLEIMEKIISALSEMEEPVTITELQKRNEEMAKYSNQKLSALLKKLSDEGENQRVVKTIDKKRSYFAIKKECGTEE